MAKSNGAIVTTLTFLRETKQFFGFANKTPGAPMRSLWLPKASFAGKAPAAIEVTIAAVSKPAAAGLKVRSPARRSKA